MNKPNTFIKPSPKLQFIFMEAVALMKFFYFTFIKNFMKPSLKTS